MKNIKNTTILIIVIVLGIILVGFFLLSQKENQNSNEQKVVEKVEKNDTGDSSLIDTSDWETYKNDKYRYEIEYPKNFIPKESNYEQTPLGKSCDVVMFFNKELPKTKIDAENTKNLQKNEISSFQIYTNPTEKCKQEQIMRRYATMASSKPSLYLGEEESVINKTKFTKKTYVAFPFGTESETPNQITYDVWELTLGKQKYIFTYDLFFRIGYVDKQNKEESPTENEFKKILSTFKTVD